MSASATTPPHGQRPRAEPAVLTLQSEFAMVEVGVDHSANGVRLRIRDCATGAVILLDPLELAALTTWDHGDLTPLVGGL